MITDTGINNTDSGIVNTDTGIFFKGDLNPFKVEN